VIRIVEDWQCDLSAQMFDEGLTTGHLIQVRGRRKEKMHLLTVMSQMSQNRGLEY